MMDNRFQRHRMCIEKCWELLFDSGRNIKILQNTFEIQAVKYNYSGFYQISFYKSGEIPILKDLKKEWKTRK